MAMCQAKNGRFYFQGREQNGHWGWLVVFALYDEKNLAMWIPGGKIFTEKGTASTKIQRGKKEKKERKNLKWGCWASLVAQWLRIHLPMQGTRVPSLVREDPHAAEQLSPWATTTEARAPRACALQQEKPLQWEAHTLQRRVAPTRCN